MLTACGNTRRADIGCFLLELSRRYRGFSDNPFEYIENRLILLGIRIIVARRKSRNTDMNRYLYGKSKNTEARRKKANKQRHTVESRTSGHKRAVIEKIDLHNLALHQAKTRVKDDCKYADKSATLQFIHGHTHGTVILEYIRDGRLKQSLESTGVKCNIWYDSPGSTYFNRL